MKVITKNEALDKMEQTNGQIFSAFFTKENGDQRMMLCRTGVKKGQKDVGLKYDPRSVGNLIVYDMKVQGYRTIKVSRLTALQINNEHLIVSQ